MTVRNTRLPASKAAWRKVFMGGFLEKVGEFRAVFLL
jgi:hypothetical protein